MQTVLHIKDYYAMLGISRAATPEQVRAAFRRAARLTHPDATGDAHSYERFILIREAYDVLSDRDRRKEYDSVLAATGSAEDGEARPFEQALRDFGISGEPYRHEWEYFVRHPDDYLNLFDSVIKALASSFLSVLAGLAVTLLVFLALFIVLPLSSAAALFLLFLSTAGSPEPLALLVMAGRSLLAKRKIPGRKLREITAALGAIVVRPLRGIPRRTGRWFIYFNYCAALALLFASGTAAARWILEKGIFQSWYGAFPALFAAVALVILIAASLPLSFEVIREALFTYPAIRYSRFTTTSRGSLKYDEKKGISQ